MRTGGNDLARWRLLLGRYAAERLQPKLGSREERMEKALDFLYSREYRGRGVRQRQKDQGRGASLDGHQLNVPHWLSEIRDLFPRETVEVVERHALERYDMKELVTDAEVLARLEPSLPLLRTLLHFKGSMPPEVLEQVRQLARRVVDDLRPPLEEVARRALSGRADRFRHSRLQLAQNLDWRSTLRDNLRNWDVERSRLMVDRVRFFSRLRRHLPWRVVLLVDQSASMGESVIHAAVMASVFARLPGVGAHLLLFDTEIVDLSGIVDDPAEVILSVQLGGGTNIGQALAYAEGLISDPERTLVVLVSDFEEGASRGRLLGVVRRLAEAGVTLLGLAALDERTEPSYDRRMAERLADLGMQIAALTPSELAAWIAERIRR